MRHTIAVLALALSPLAARAAGSGVELGLRTGLSIPFGDIAGGASLSDSISVGIPVQADLGYRFSPYVYAGVYGGYSYLFPKNCPSGADCSAHNYRLGGNVQFHPAGDAPFDPWFGVGFGYEWLSLSLSSGGSSQDLDVHGFEFANLQAGVDLGVSPRFKIGPVLTFSIAEYREGSTSGSLGSGSGELTDKKLHEWLVVGVRATFLP